MSWFYPLQKLFGYEVSPEDDTTVVQAHERATRAVSFSYLRKRGEQQKAFDTFLRGNAYSWNLAGMRKQTSVQMLL